MKYSFSVLICVCLLACGESGDSVDDKKMSDLEFILNDIQEIQASAGPAPEMREEDLAAAAKDAAPLLQVSDDAVARDGIDATPADESAALVDTRNSAWYYRQLRTYEKQHPDATQAELDAYVDEILMTQPEVEAAADSKVLARGYAFIDNVKPDYVLNPAEVAIYSQNKVIGLKMLAAGKAALDMSYAYWRSGFTDGNADAFRHCLWNVYMCSIANCTWAKKWGDAHEAYNSTGMPRQMDLNNNAFGRNLFGYYGSYATYWVPQATWGGYLVRIVNARYQVTNFDGYRY